MENRTRGLNSGKGMGANVLGKLNREYRAVTFANSMMQDPNLQTPQRRSKGIELQRKYYLWRKGKGVASMRWKKRKKLRQHRTAAEGMEMEGIPNWGNRDMDWSSVWLATVHLILQRSLSPHHPPSTEKTELRIHSHSVPAGWTHGISCESPQYQ